MLVFYCYCFALALAEVAHFIEIISHRLVRFQIVAGQQVNKLQDREIILQCDLFHIYNIID